MARLEEFRAAQEAVWDRVVGELRAGRKTSHWIWFVFPQLAGLGHSPMAQKYALSGVQDAARYLADPILGSRLVEAAELLLAAGTDPVAVLGPVDAMKVRSSMTLFEAVPEAPAVFGRVLDRLYHGSRCNFTRERTGGN